MSKFYTKCLETYATFRIQHSLSHITRHPITSLPSITSNITWCHTLLTSVSRSFALVIASLPDDVRLPVTCMYLLLRALDTVEDDMSVPLTTKKQLLLTFHERLHTQKCDDLHGYGDTPECRYLLQQLTRVIDVYQTLPASYRTIITDVVSRMGHGMTEFLRESNDHTQACMEIDTIVEYNLYGHYVAGIVGHALSQLWTTSGHEDISLAQENVLSNSMGLLLQKTNMIRDYREDVTEHRFWWPRQVWSLYGDSLKELGDFPHRSESISCLNHMITDALTHVPDCLDYLSRLHDPRLFASCAIPQVLAFATLSHMYANPLVYTQPLRIPQGLTCHIMIRCRDMKEVSMWMNRFAREMRERVSEKDRGVKRTLDLLTLIQRLSQQHITRAYHPHHVIRRTIHLIIVFFLACFLFMWCLDSATCTSYLISSPAPISWLSLPLVSLSSIKWSPTATATATAVPIPVHTSTVDVTR